jgi:hypothetical protein
MTMKRKVTVTGTTRRRVCLEVPPVKFYKNEVTTVSVWRQKYWALNVRTDRSDLLFTPSFDQRHSWGSNAAWVIFGPISQTGNELHIGETQKNISDAEMRRKFLSPFVEYKGSLPCSHKLVIGHCAEPDKPSPYSGVLFPCNPLYVYISQFVTSVDIFRLKFCTNF